MTKDEFYQIQREKAVLIEDLNNIRPELKNTHRIVLLERSAKRKNSMAKIVSLNLMAKKASIFRRLEELTNEEKEYFNGTFPYRDA